MRLGCCSSHPRASRKTCRKESNWLVSNEHGPASQNTNDTVTKKSLAVPSLNRTVVSPVGGACPSTKPSASVLTCASHTIPTPILKLVLCLGSLRTPTIAPTAKESSVFSALLCIEANGPTAIMGQSIGSFAQSISSCFAAALPVLVSML